MPEPLGDPVETLLIDVRAGTQGFAQDVAAMRATFDGTLVDGFERAGGVLERGLLGAIRKGSLGFDDLRRIALSVLDDIAMQAMRGLFSGGGGGSATGGLLDLSGVLGSILGLPGRATGGPVAPGRGYVVGERGPELFVPTTSGRVETTASVPRSIAITVNVQGSGSGEPQRLAQTGRQLARAVRRAIAEGEG